MTKQKRGESESKDQKSSKHSRSDMSEDDDKANKAKSSPQFTMTDLENLFDRKLSPLLEKVDRADKNAAEALNVANDAKTNVAACVHEMKGLHESIKSTCESVVKDVVKQELATMAPVSDTSAAALCTSPLAFIICRCTSCSSQISQKVVVHSISRYIST